MIEAIASIVIAVSLVVLVVALSQNDSVQRERKFRNDIELELRRKGEWREV